MHPNTKYLMRWNNRMLKKFGQPETGIDWCRKLAYSVGEAGKDNPSDSAINIAETWERMTPEEIRNV